MAQGVPELQVPIGKSRAANGTVVKRGFKDCSLDSPYEVCSSEAVAALKKAKAATAALRMLKCIMPRERIENDKKRKIDQRRAGWCTREGI